MAATTFFPTANNCFANPIAVTSLRSCFFGGKDSNAGVVTFYIDALLFVTSVASFLYLLFGVYKMFTAFGNEATYTDGRKAVIAALVGLFISVSALALVNLFVTQILHAPAVNLN